MRLTSRTVTPQVAGTAACPSRALPIDQSLYHVVRRRPSGAASWPLTRLRARVTQTSNDRILAAIDGLQDALRGTPAENWFRVHRNRYLSDLGFIAEYYRQGEILEVGAFPCHMTILLKQMGYPTVAVDIAPERAAGLVNHHQLDIRACDVERQPLPFEAGRFQFVVFNEIFEHLRVDPLYALTQVHRVLRSDGVIMLSTPNLYALHQIAKYLLGRGIGDPLAEFEKLRSVGHMGHIREYSNRDVCRMLFACGFDVIETRWLRHYYYPPGKRGFAARMVYALAPRKLRSTQVVFARKCRDAPVLEALF